MMFKRRRPRDTFGNFREWLWPKAGWSRAAQYVWHRLLRIKDGEHSIALGLAVGAGVSASPFLGTHFVTAALIAWFLGGNIIASAIGTWVGNPFTFPFIWISSFNVGNFLLGRDSTETAFSAPALESLFQSPLEFFGPVLLPMTVGALPVGLVLGVATYIPSNILIDAYKRKRARKQAAEKNGESGV